MNSKPIKFCDFFFVSKFRFFLLLVELQFNVKVHFFAYVNSTHWIWQNFAFIRLSLWINYSAFEFYVKRIHYSGHWIFAIWQTLSSTCKRISRKSSFSFFFLQLTFFSGFFGEIEEEASKNGTFSRFIISILAFASHSHRHKTCIIKSKRVERKKK